MLLVVLLRQRHRVLQRFYNKQFCIFLPDLEKTNNLALSFESKLHRIHRHRQSLLKLMLHLQYYVLMVLIGRMKNHKQLNHIWKLCHT